jgi:hypothetical protein
MATSLDSASLPRPGFYEHPEDLALFLLRTAASFEAPAYPVHLPFTLTDGGGWKRVGPLL